MARRIISFFSISLLCFCLNGCYYDKAQLLQRDNGFCDTMSVTFSANVNNIVTQNCISCHGSSAPSGGISLEGYTNIEAAGMNGKLLGSITHSAGFSAMPKNSPKLDDCSIRMITKWVNNGMPNN